jgi:hypothetical protein
VPAKPANFAAGMPLDLKQLRELCEPEFADPKTTDYCTVCGESPDSGSHLPHGHEYQDPRMTVERAFARARALPMLLAAVEELYAAVEELQAALDETCAVADEP